MTLYLASQSPRRKELLARLRLPFEVLPTPVGVDMEALEAVLPNETPARYVRRVAVAKLDLALRHPKASLGDIILAADTTVAADSLILGKPETAENNAAMLRKLSGRSHRVLTVVAVEELGESDLSVKLCIAHVRFASLSEAQITRYVASGEGLDKAGGYAIQGAAAAFVTHISGDYSGIVGLPLHATATLLQNYFPKFLA